MITYDATDQYSSEENENDLGNCQFCGAPNTRNPRTGKVYCSAKCWLNNPVRPTTATRPTTSPQYTPHRYRSQVGSAPDWDAIRRQRDEAIRQNMLIKAEGQAKGASFKAAVDIALAMYNKGDITYEVIIAKVAELMPSLMEINANRDDKHDQ